MKENFSNQPVPNPEECKFEIVTVSNDNIQDLETIRRDVDVEQGATTTPEKFSDELKRYASGGEHVAYLIQDGRKIIGFVESDLKDDYLPKGANRELCEELKDHGHIARIGLLSEYRGRRIGNQLLDHAEAWLKAHGMVAAWLDYLPGNEKLVTFYEEAGYVTLIDFKDGDKNRLRRIAVKHF